MPSVWRVHLGSVEAADVSLAAVHAVVSRWLDTDHRAALKPYSVTPLHRVGDGACLEIGLLDDKLSQRLRDRTRSAARVRLGSHYISGPPTMDLILAEDWTALTADSGSRAWALRFLTPTTFRHANRYSPWPDPITVVTGLHRRLAEFAPHRPPLPRLRRDHLWVTDIDGASEILNLAGRTVSGFVGRVRYEIAPDAPGAAIIDTLMRLRRYAGVGAHTTHGLGVTMHEPTWQPAPTPDQ